MTRRRTLDAVRFVAENASAPTHPLGCMAALGWHDDDTLAWLVRVCQCPHDHPITQADLERQYADNGWVNVDGG